MKYIIGIDASTKCTGVAVFDDSANLVKLIQIKPKTTLSTIDKICYIADKFSDLIVDLGVENQFNFVIEDIFLNTFFGGKSQVVGFANLGRLSGALITSIHFLIGKPIDEMVELIMAISARPKVKLKGNCQKCETQAWALAKFTDIDVSPYEGMIEAVKAKKIVKDIDQKEYKKRMEEISKIIEEETGYGEDKADALVLGYGKAKK